MSAERPDRVRDPLVIHSVEFLGGIEKVGGWRPPTSLPEIAFAGRSNVGKSSLINVLVRRKKAARVSNTPGRTREINFFDVNGLFVLVDLPVYGYARVSKERKAEWGPLIEGYLHGSALLRGVVQLLDARHAPSDQDLQMLELLARLGTPTIVVATKIDKLSSTRRAVRIKDLALEAGVDGEQVIPFSAVSGEGRDDLASAIVDLLASPHSPTP